MPAPNGHPVQTREVPEKQSTLVEPSMEDILASIRRIIAADQTGNPIRGGFAPPKVDAGAATAAAPEPTAPDVEPPSVPLHDIAVEEHWNPDAPAVSVDPVDDLEPPTTALLDAGERSGLVEAASESRNFDAHHRSARHEDMFPHEEAMADTDEAPGSQPAETLISSAAGDSVSSSFQALARTMLFQDPETVERMARDALRPMLKAWLDENLPSMVERLVRTEIERVARGGRSRD